MSVPVRHPMNDIHSVFIQQAQKLWKIPIKTLVDSNDITWRTANTVRIRNFHLPCGLGKG